MRSEIRSRRFGAAGLSTTMSACRLARASGLQRSAAKRRSATRSHLLSTRRAGTVGRGPRGGLAPWCMHALGQRCANACSAYHAASAPGPRVAACRSHRSSSHPWRVHPPKLPRPAHCRGPVAAPRPPVCRHHQIEAVPSLRARPQVRRQRVDAAREQRPAPVGPLLGVPRRRGAADGVGERRARRKHTRAPPSGMPVGGWGRVRAGAREQGDRGGVGRRSRRRPQPACCLAPGGLQQRTRRSNARQPPTRAPQPYPQEAPPPEAPSPTPDPTLAGLPRSRTPPP